MSKFQLQHTGYPVGSRVIEESEWKQYSKHINLRAAIRAYDKATEHLQVNQWDDNYRFVDPTGNVLTIWDIEQERYQNIKIR